MKHEIYELALQNPFLQENGVEWMRLEKTTPWHIVFERIFVNVSAQIGAKWGDLQPSEEAEDYINASYIVCYSLIVNFFYNIIGLAESAIMVLIGEHNYYEVKDFFKYLQQTKR